ncbi:hypothetical protein SUDANB145_02656 [Streptomyces sp. enrichment culture]
MAAQRDPNSRLRDVIAAVDCTYEALARDVRRIAAENGEILQTNKSAISHWVNGTRAPSGRSRPVPRRSTVPPSGTYGHPYRDRPARR